MIRLARCSIDVTSVPFLGTLPSIISFSIYPSLLIVSDKLVVGVVSENVRVPSSFFLGTKEKRERERLAARSLNTHLPKATNSIESTVRNRRSPRLSSSTDGREEQQQMNNFYSGFKPTSLTDWVSLLCWHKQFTDLSLTKDMSIHRFDQISEVLFSPSSPVMDEAHFLAGDKRQPMACRKRERNQSVFNGSRKNVRSFAYRLACRSVLFDTWCHQFSLSLVRWRMPIPVSESFLFGFEREKRCDSDMHNVEGKTHRNDANRQTRSRAKKKKKKRERGELWSVFYLRLLSSIDRIGSSCSSTARLSLEMRNAPEDTEHSSPFARFFYQNICPSCAPEQIQDPQLTAELLYAFDPELIEVESSSSKFSFLLLLLLL